MPGHQARAELELAPPMWWVYQASGKTLQSALMQDELQGLVTQPVGCVCYAKRCQREAGPMNQHVQDTEGVHNQALNSVSKQGVRTVYIPARQAAQGLTWAIEA